MLQEPHVYTLKSCHSKIIWPFQSSNVQPIYDLSRKDDIF